MRKIIQETKEIIEITKIKIFFLSILSIVLTPFFYERYGVYSEHWFYPVLAYLGIFLISYILLATKDILAYYKELYADLPLLFILRDKISLIIATLISTIFLYSNYEIGISYIFILFPVFFIFPFALVFIYNVFLVVLDFLLGFVTEESRPFLKASKNILYKTLLSKDEKWRVKH